MDGGIWRSRRRRLLPHGKYGPDRVPHCHRNRFWTHTRPHMTSEENQGKIDNEIVDNKKAQEIFNDIENLKNKLEDISLD